MLSITVFAMLNQSTIDHAISGSVPSGEVDAAFFRASAPHTAAGWGHWAGVLVRSHEGTNPNFRGELFQRLWVMSDAEQTRHRITDQYAAQVFADRLAADVRRELDEDRMWQVIGRITSFSAPSASAPPVVTTPPVVRPPVTQTPPATRPPTPQPVVGPAYIPPPESPDETPWGWIAVGAVLAAGAVILIATDKP